MSTKTGSKGYIVAIDGPSGAGKSTVSRKLAEALKGKLMDTGAMYRGIAYLAIKAKAQEEAELALLAKKVKFDIDLHSDTMLINGEDLGNRLRSQRVSKMASQISQHKSVRTLLTRRQRSLGKKWSHRCPIVVEGRDIGTIVFPNVRFKFFVTADAEVRAQRRFQQLKKQGTRGLTLKKILRQHQERDRRDSTRKLAPLKCPKDAVIVDTSHLGISQVVQFMQNHILSRSFPET